jgi:hypothetical protein
MSSNPTAPAPAVRAVVSVATMAKAIGLSRSRFYELVQRGVFPLPLYALSSKRPFYTAEAQQAIHAVRQTGLGVNGEYVIFYQRDGSARPLTGGRLPVKPPASATEVSALMAGLAALGLGGIAAADVAKAVATCFPTGIVGRDDGDVLRVLYRHLRGSSGGGNNPIRRPDRVRPPSAP